MNCLSCKRETPNAKFCSRSCSVKFNNTLKPKRTKTSHYCKRCNLIQVARTGWICDGCNLRKKVFFKNKSWDELNRDDYRRRRLLDERGVQCEICKLTEWMGQPIPVEIDHIDGNHSNNDKCNLRIVCCNCHAQTPTYRGRNKRLKRQRLAVEATVLGTGSTPVISTIDADLAQW